MLLALVTIFEVHLSHRWSVAMYVNHTEGGTVPAHEELSSFMLCRQDWHYQAPP